jgi:hypothetical protein
MAKCIYCLKETTPENKETDDHVLARSLYASDVPENLEKWAVPSCGKCNGEKSKLENYVLVHWGLGVDQDDPAYKDIADRANRAISPEYGKNEKDKMSRENLRKKVMSELFQINGLPDKGIVSKNVKPSPSGQYTGVKVDPEKIYDLCRRIIKGLHYVLDGRYVTDSQEIQVMFVDEQKIEGGLREFFSKFTGLHEQQGPSFRVTRMHANGDPNFALYVVTIWETIRFYAFIQEKKLK